MLTRDLLHLFHLWTGAIKIRVAAFLDILVNRRRNAMCTDENVLFLNIGKLVIGADAQRFQSGNLLGIVDQRPQRCDRTLAFLNEFFTFVDGCSHTEAKSGVWR